MSAVGNEVTEWPIHLVLKEHLNYFQLLFFNLGAIYASARAEPMLSSARAGHRLVHLYQGPMLGLALAWRGLMHLYLGPMFSLAWLDAD